MASAFLTPSLHWSGNISRIKIPVFAGGAELGQLLLQIFVNSQPEMLLSRKRREPIRQSLAPPSPRFAKSKSGLGVASLSTHQIAQELNARLALAGAAGSWPKRSHHVQTDIQRIRNLFQCRLLGNILHLQCIERQR